MRIEEIVRETENLLREKKERKGEDLEEITLKIHCNIQALKYLYRKNEYPSEMKENVMGIINRLGKLDSELNRQERSEEEVKKSEGQERSETEVKKSEGQERKYDSNEKYGSEPETGKYDSNEKYCSETTITRKRNSDIARKRKNEDEINEELLKGAIELRKMAENFTESLKKDKTALKYATEKMSKNSVENRENFKVLQAVSGNAKLSTYFMVMLMIFIGMYFFIKLV